MGIEEMRAMKRIKGHLEWAIPDVPDQAVVAQHVVIEARERRRTFFYPEVPLSERCANAPKDYERAEALLRSGARIEGDMRVVAKGSRIGTVDRFGRFFFQTAPSLAACLAWAVATDVGRERDPPPFDIEAMEQRIRYVLDRVPSHSTLRIAFYDHAWTECMRELFPHPLMSRLPGGYKQWAQLLWVTGLRTQPGSNEAAMVASQKQLLSFGF